MKLSDDEVIDRISDTLSTWANEEPVGAPSWTTLVELSPSVTIPRPPRHSGVWWVAAAAAMMLVVAAAVVVSHRGDPAALVDVGPTPSGVTEIPIAESFGVRGLDVTEDAVWVTSTFDEELYRVDPTTNKVIATFPIPDHVEGVRSVGGWLWLSRYEPNELIRVDPATGALTTRLAFESQPALADRGDRLWVVAERDGQSRAVEIDPDTATIVDEIPLDQPAGSATVSDGDLWVANSGATTVSQVELATHRTIAEIDVGGEPRSIVAANGSIWVAVNVAGPEPTGKVVRIDPDTETVTTSVTTGRWAHSLAADGDSVWVTNFVDGTASVIDARSAEVVATTPIGNRPGGVAVGHGSVWITAHRRNVLLRIDPTVPLEAAATPDIARSVDVGTGTVYVRCSGNGGPTVIIEGNTGEGPAWAIVEARLSRTTRVCVYEPVGVADPAEIGQAGPASQVADDLASALDTIGEVGPFVVVGDWMGGLYAQMFAAMNPDVVVGMVLVHGLSADYFELVSDVLPADALERMGLAFHDQPGLQWLNDSLIEVAEIEGFGELPLVVLSDASADPAEMSTGSHRLLTLAESEAIGQLLESTQRELAARSTAGRFVMADSPVTPDDIVTAVTSVIGA